MPLRRLLPALCTLVACTSEGDPRQVRQAITNGTPDTVPAHAAVVALFDQAAFVCSGTLVAPRVVLTAGHCVKGAQAARLQVGFGPTTAAAELVAVAEAKAHPGYSANSLAHDLGLLRLAAPPPQGVVPIPALPPSLALTAGETVTVDFSGFGNDENGEYGTKLHVSDGVDLVCETAGGCAWAGDLTPEHTFCYDQQPGGPCSGDSGGPAFLVREGVEYVAGVTSYGDRNCTSDGCSTKVDAYHAFLSPFVGQVGPKDDGAACAEGAECQTGFCVDGVCCNLACQSAGCTACSQARGARADGVCTPIAAACDDGNRCTLADRCDGGRCVGDRKDCPAPDSCHLASSCDADTGECRPAAAMADGAACDDGDECVTSETCQAGVCRGTARATCPSPDPCQRDAACADKKCGEFLPKAEGAACEDGDLCTTGETCQAGDCVEASRKECPPEPCHGWGRCDPSTGSCILGVTLPDGRACDDGNGCTSGDACRAGHCEGTLVTGACPAPSPCHGPGTCKADGTCDAPVLEDGTSCEDGDLCTTGEACKEGACLPALTKNCDVPDPCHTGDRCDPRTGLCLWSFETNGTACDDGNPCTSDTTCQSGLCRGTVAACAPPGECRFAGHCDAILGDCVYNWKPEGTACTGGTCQRGECRTRGTGCAAAPGATAPLAFALTALLGLGRRRRP